MGSPQPPLLPTRATFLFKFFGLVLGRASSEAKLWSPLALKTEVFPSCFQNLSHPWQKQVKTMTCKLGHLKMHNQYSHASHSLQLHNSIIKAMALREKIHPIIRLFCGLTRQAPVETTNYNNWQCSKSRTLLSRLLLIQIYFAPISVKLLSGYYQRACCIAVWRSGPPSSVR